jgi:hypothetical protein
MKIIARPQGTGKTRELLNQAYINHAQVLTTNKRALQAKSDAYLIPDVSIIDWNDLVYGNYDKNKPLYIHKLADVVQELLDNDFEGLKLECFTVTTENDYGEV